MEAVPDILDEEKLTADQAAKLLGVEKRTVYAWAKAQKIECIRMGDAVRFTRTFIREYLEKCRSTTKKAEAVTATSSTVSLRDSDSELRSFFQKHGAATKPKATRKNKTRASTPLQLAHSSKNR